MTRLEQARVVSGLAVVVAAMALAAFGGRVLAGEVPPCSAGDDAETATVAAVIDGDTVRLGDGRVVRLAGIAAPKRPLDLGDDAPWPPGAAARDGLARILGGGAVRIAIVGEEPDRHRRWRANLYRGADNAWVQALTTEAGLARVQRLPGDPACVFALLGPEAAARTAGLGLWASPHYAVRAADDPSLLDRNGLYELVEGRIASVGHGSYMIFLDFGREYWRDFTIMVAPPVAEALATAGLPAGELQGRLVRVRGVIEASGGPAVRLNDPGELELLDDGGDTDDQG